MVWSVSVGNRSTEGSLGKYLLQPAVLVTPDMPGGQVTAWKQGKVASLVGLEEEGKVYLGSFKKILIVAWLVKIAPAWDPQLKKEEMKALNEQGEGKAEGKAEAAAAGSLLT